MNLIPKCVISEIKKKHIEYIRYTWCDNAGVIVAKAIHKNYLVNSTSSRYIGFPKPHINKSTPINSSYFGLGDVELKPDWDTFISIPYSNGHAKVITDIYNHDTPWPHCSRSFLKKTIERAANYNLSFQIAFENEFYILSKKNGNIEPYDQSIFAQSYALDKAEKILTDITKACISQNMFPEILHAESGNGQFELSIKHIDTLAAADQQVNFRETVRAVTQKYDGLMASFLPKIFPDQAGNGAHIHISLWKNDKNITSDSNNPQFLSKTASFFLAGILQHIQSLMCITTPTVNSYRRIKPHSWSGAYACWGYDNREAAIRIPRASTHRPITNIEIKTSDPTSNPYIALGGIISAGLDGIEQKIPLCNQIDRDPGNLTQHERNERKITTLPTNLGDAITHLKKDTFLIKQMGEDLALSYITLKESEWNKMKNWTIEKDVETLIERY